MWKTMARLVGPMITDIVITLGASAPNIGRKTHTITAIPLTLAYSSIWLEHQILVSQRNIIPNVMPHGSLIRFGVSPAIWVTTNSLSMNSATLSMTTISM